MSIFEHSRFEIWNQSQHPFRHSLEDFSYTNEALPGVSTVEGALNYMTAVFYPKAKAAVANPAALPAVGNTINDYRVVTDDGDGKAASYRWEQREGDVAAKWWKIYDMDWGETSVLSAFLLKTQDVYVYRHGYDDIDSSGSPVAGTLAGQAIYGGASAATNLTLYANSGDGVGAGTGYVQAGDNVRPTADSTYSFGTTSERWLKIWTDEVTIGTMTITGGSILDSSGTISFDDEDLSTTGSLSAASLTATASVSSLKSGSTIGTLTFADGSITDSGGAVSFGNETLSTSSTMTTGTLLMGSGSITDSSGAISFGNEDLSTTGTLSVGGLSIGQLAIDDLFLNDNKVSISTADTNLALAANGTGVVDVQSNMDTLDITATGQIDADNLRLDGNTLSSTDTDGNVIVSPDGNGLVEMGAGVFPTTTSADDLGSSGNVWNKLWLDGAIGDGSTEISLTTLLSFKNALSGATTGDVLFYNSVSGDWESSNPDTEITHSELGSLTTGDAGHTQFAVLAGRSGGQALIGGTDASDNLSLESTSNGSKGEIEFKDVLRPDGDGTLDVGASSYAIKDLYIAGQGVGFRAQNATTAGEPAAGAGTKGRLYWNTDTNKLRADVGGTWVNIGGNEKFTVQDAVNWTGSVKTYSYDVSSTITDARLALWSFYDNANNFEQIMCDIAKTATHVTVTTVVNLPAGTYTLVGVS